MKGKNLVLLATNRAELFAPTGVGFLIGAGLRIVSIWSRAPYENSMRSRAHLCGVELSDMEAILHINSLNKGFSY